MWKITKYSAIIGGFILMVSFGAGSAPQQAAAAAIAVGLAVIPYVVSRANQEIDRQDIKEQLKAETRQEILNEIEQDL